MKTIQYNTGTHTEAGLPKVLTPRVVQFYCHHMKELMQSQKHKVRKFLENDCIEYDPKRKIYLCHPIPGYNTRTYELVKTGFVEGPCEWECNCQFYQRNKQMCSHMATLYAYFKIKHWKGGINV